MIGDLRHRVEIQVVSATADAQGGQTETWTRETYAWVAIHALKAEEQMVGDDTQMVATHLMRMRHYAAFDGARRIVFGSRTFEIVGWRDVEERGRWIEARVKEVLP